MTPAPTSRQPVATQAALVAHDRRKRAAWLDYLRVTGEAAHGEYESAELNAWEQLQRRLRRNDELLAMATQGAAATARA